MNRRTYLATACVGTAALSGCLSVLPSDKPDTPLPTVPNGTWTQHGANSANTFVSDVAAPPRGNLAWESAAFTRWDPVITDGTVYTTNFDPSNEGSAIALDAQDGSEQWRTVLEGAGDHGRALVDDLFVVAHSEELVALDRRNGDIVWRRPFEKSISTGKDYSPELIAVDERSGIIVVPYRDGLEAFRATDGEPQWETAGVSQQQLTPAIHDGTIYAVGRIDGTDSLAAFDLTDGTARWTRALTDASTSADPVVTERGVFVVDGDTLGIHDHQTRERDRDIHVFESGEVHSTTVAVDRGTAFVANDEELLAVDIEAGTTRWRHDDEVYAQGFSVGSETVVAMVDGSEYVSTELRETITAFDRETGDVRWNYVLDGFHSVTIPPILVGGAVFFATSSIGGLAVLGDVDSDD
ncbi:outer membrane biogenesis protein BamB [Halolamina pelagica]|uniref:Outer membrane biogenesis protein BamB n=1 Tax=Halolamina pelagica TaxID=699431 RepID=A0A0P7H6I7_9EURY|nr:PQQ-binding-like beta-propeller repeat protein [Halolamina pelagica]KPN28988.1 outer membrane biogenesis protein BamB [Halolamina pelagica]